MQEMTIDEAVRHVDSSSLRAYEPEVADIVVDIMHRYQKIEMIVMNSYGVPVVRMLDEVMKVIEEKTIK